MTQARGCRYVQRMEIKESAPILVVGIIMSVIGGAIFSVQQQSYLYEQLTSSGWSSPSPGGMVWGALIALVGLVMTLVGVNRLAANVDRAASAAKGLAEIHALIAKSAAPSEAPGASEVD